MFPVDLSRVKTSPVSIDRGTVIGTTLCEYLDIIEGLDADVH